MLARGYNSGFGLQGVCLVLLCYSVASRTREVYLHTYVFCLLLGDQVQDGAAVFAGSDQDLKPRSPRRQRGRQLVMDMAVTIKGILRDFWCREEERGKEGGRG